MNLTLYHNPISTCSQKVRLVLAEKGLSFTSEVIDFGMQDHLSESYLKINQNGVVPSLVHDGNPVTDSSVICEYLDEVYSEVSLSPSTPLKRAEMRAWMRYLEEVPTVAIRIPSFHKVFYKSISRMTDEKFSEMIEKMPLRQVFYKKIRNGTALDASAQEDSMERLDNTLVRAENALKTSNYLCSNKLSLADIVLLPTIVRMEDLGLSHVWSKKPNVSRWFSAIKARPSFDVAYYPGTRINPKKYDIGF